MARVVNIADGFPAGAVYIGRSRSLGYPVTFGNPFMVGKDGDRAEVLAKFRAWFRSRLAEDPGFWYEVQQLVGKTLVCHCKPMDCHGDVIAEYLEKRYDDPWVRE